MIKEEKEKSYENQIEGRNPVLEALRATDSKNPVERLFIQEGLRDSVISTILRTARKQDVIIEFVNKERLDNISENGKHQGVIAKCASYSYASVDDIMELAVSKNEPPFIIVLDDIEDPHNLGSIIRSANHVGAHGVIIHKRHACTLTPSAVKASAGAVSTTLVAKVTNISKAINELKDKGLWAVCADMDGTSMWKLNLTGGIILVIGNEGKGVSRLVRESCDMVASIPSFGNIESLNASVASGILMYEISRQRHS